MHVVELSFFIQDELSIFGHQTDCPKIRPEIMKNGHQDGQWGLALTMKFWSKFLESKNRIFDSNVVRADLDDYGKSGRGCHHESSRHRYHLNCDISDMSEAFIRCMKRYKIFHIIEPNFKSGFWGTGVRTWLTGWG